MHSRKHIKVAFVGTSCTGKTSLIEVYKERAKIDSNYVIVEEAARLYFQQNPIHPDPFAYHVQQSIQDIAFKNEQKAHQSEREFIICDRSVLDAVAYEISQRGMETAMQLFDRVRNWISTYTALFLLNPADVPFKNDAIRKEDSKTRELFHQGFLTLFHTQRIPYILLSGTIKERVQKVDQFLQLKNNSN